MNKMIRKILSVTMAALLACSLLACGSSGGRASAPAEAVKEFSECMKKFDREGMMACLEENVTLGQNTFDEMVGGLEEFLTEQAAKITYKIGDVKIDGDTATVAVTYTFPDYYDVAKATYPEYLKQGRSVITGGGGVEELPGLFADIFAEKQKKAKIETTQSTAIFTCKQVGDKWRISEVPSEAINVMTCNCLKVFVDMAEQFGTSPVQK